MMHYKNILVVVDPHHQEQPALQRALTITKLDEEASITLFLAIFDFSYEMTAMLSTQEREAMRSAMVDERKKWLDDLITPFKDKAKNLILKVVWHSRPFESIIQQVLEAQHDLVIKSTHQHPKLQSVIFTPTDWHLLRKCPTPLLLVKDHEWPANGNILAAVNCVADNEHHVALNNAIIKEGNAFATALDSTLHLVNAYPGTPINLALELPEFDATDYSEAVKKHHQQQLNQLANNYHIADDATHLVEGQPEYAVAELATEIDAELVILGTIGRSGFSAAIIGNTAEHIIDQLNCDLLAIKPPDYVSPFQL